MRGDKMKHYIGMAGLRGCLPNYCVTHDTHDDAVMDLADTHELGRDRTRRLKRDSFLLLNLHRDGNEYCEITECDCDDPGIHNDC